MNALQKAIGEAYAANHEVNTEAILKKEYMTDTDIKVDYMTDEQYKLLFSEE